MIRQVYCDSVRFNEFAPFRSPLYRTEIFEICFSKFRKMFELHKQKSVMNSTSINNDTNTIVDRIGIYRYRTFILQNDCHSILIFTDGLLVSGRVESFLEKLL